MNKFDVFVDVQKYIRKLSIKRHFLSKAADRNFISYHDTSYVHTNLRNASTFNPPLANNNKVNLFRDLVLKELEEKKLPPRQYMDGMEGVKTLCENKNLIIRPADKGGGIVLLNKSAYIEEMNNLLADPNTYEILSRDPTMIYKERLEKLVKRGFEEGIICKKEK